MESGLKPHDRVGIAALMRQLAGACDRGEITLHDAALTLTEWAGLLEAIAEREAKLAKHGPPPPR